MSDKGDVEQPTSEELRAKRLSSLRELAGEQDDIVSRRQLYGLGFSRGEVRAQVRASRWQRVGSQSLALHTGPLTVAAQLWAAVFEGGPRAHLDGVSALLASGLQHFTAPSIRVSVPRGARCRRPNGLNVRQTRRWSAESLAPMGLPRTRPEVAAVRAALWAESDRQAALLVTMSVQQGLTTAERVGEALLAVRRDRRRLLIQTVVLDLLGGVRSLGELDVLRGCRERGLPEPDKQVLVRTRRGSYYLDFRWKAWALVVEVDGIQHEWAQSLVGDALRHNTIALAGDTVLRLPLLGLRVAPEDFFGQIETALRQAGWRGETA